jgi:hypothetical protein
LHRAKLHSDGRCVTTPRGQALLQPPISRRHPQIARSKLEPGPTLESQRSCQSDSSTHPYCDNTLRMVNPARSSICAPLKITAIVSRSGQTTQNVAIAQVPAPCQTHHLVRAVSSTETRFDCVTGFLRHFAFLLHSTPLSFIIIHPPPQHHSVVSANPALLQVEVTFSVLQFPRPTHLASYPVS